MQKGVFSTWLKELCALVFIQTIQAFILAIVLSIILTFIYPSIDPISKVAKITSQDSVSALGVLCIILLTSLTKIEQITKKIFGLESSFLKDKPPHGLVASYLAIKAAGKIFNNVPKLVGGIGSATFGAGKDKKRAMSNNLRRLSHAGLNMDGTPSGGGMQNDNLPLGGGTLDANTPDTNPNGGTQNNNLPSGRGTSPNTPDTSLNKIPNFNNNLNNTNVKPNLNAKDKSSDYWKIMEKYEDELSAAKAKRSKGIRDAISGFSETIGAATGALAGGSIGLVSGLATNDLDQIPKAMGYGIGAGDMIGESAVKVATKPIDAVKSIKSYNKVYNKLDNDLSAMEDRLKMQNQRRKKAATRLKEVQNEIRKVNNINGIE